MTSYVLAFGILGFGIGLAAVMWGIPRLRRRLELRRFRKQLAHVDFVALAWRESLRNGSAGDDLPMPSPEGRRGRIRRRGEPEPGGELV